MKNLNKFRVTASPVQAANKLKRANIPVYNCKKDGAYFMFEVGDNYIKKVFAIFAHPCYNVTIRRKSTKKRLANILISRPMLFIGAAAFVAVCIVSNSFVLKISVTGSGSYLKNEVLSIAYSSGVTPCSIYRGVDEPSLCARVMALPYVTFCSVSKSGCVLYIDVQTEGESAVQADYSSLYADVSGTVIKISVICGTPLVTSGQSVNKGDMLVGAYYLSGEEKISCMAVGYAKIEAASSLSLFYDAENEETRNSALAAALLYAQNDEITSRSVTSKKVSDGVIYTVDFTYLHTISINFD